MLDGNASIDFESRQVGPEPPRAADPRGVGITKESRESVEFVSHYAEEPIEWSKEFRHGRIGPSEGPTILDGNASIDFESRQVGPEPPRAADPRGIAEEFRYGTLRRAPARPRRPLQLAHGQSDPEEECPLNLFQPRIWPSRTPRTWTIRAS